METLQEIRVALTRLPIDDRLAIGAWLQEYDGPGTRAYGVREPGSTYAAPEPLIMTLDEYFAFEEQSELRHEFVNGAVFAMSGASPRHERVRTRLATNFIQHLKGGPCEVFSLDVNLLIKSASDEICYRPDIMVDCHREDWNERHLRNPKLIVEILSPSTHQIDRREKFDHYRLVDSVEEYALVAQEEHKLIIHRRADGWRPQLHKGPDTFIEFRSLDLTLPLSVIYEDIL